MADTFADTDQIEADIARTRARMDDRLDQLQDHLSPKQMLNDAFAYLRGGDGANISKDLFAKARANPIPLALIGVGIAWLMASSASGGRVASGDDLDDATRSLGLSDRQPTPQPVLSNSQDIRTMAKSTQQTLSSLVSNPFALGALAAIGGAVAGALIPTFDQEEGALGGAATKIREKGRDLAQGIVDSGSRVAGETLDAVKDSAGARGLSADKPVGEVVTDLKSGTLIDDAKAVAQEALQAGQDSVQRHLALQKEAETDGADRP